MKIFVKWFIEIQNNLMNLFNHENEMSGTNIDKTIFYYDKIAKDYDKEIQRDFNKEVRTGVKNYVLSISGITSLLDFGAGTGGDLNWQLEAGFLITFYEPSKNMASIAERSYNLRNQELVKTLIGEKANYISLKEEGKKDLIFSNFAAINSVKNIEELFTIFSSIINNEGHLIIVAYLPKSKRFLSDFFSFTKEMTIAFGNSTFQMTAYLHSSKRLVTKAKKNRLLLIKKMVLGDSGFILYHFKKTA